MGKQTYKGAEELAEVFYGLSKTSKLPKFKKGVVLALNVVYGEGRTDEFRSLLKRGLIKVEEKTND